MQIPVLELKPSRWLLGWIAVIHLLAGAAVWVAVLSLGLRWLLLAGVGTSLLVLLQRELGRRGDVLVPRTLTRWRLQSIKGKETEADLLDVRVFRYLVILHFGIVGQRWSRLIPIAADAVPADSHRRLRAALKRWEDHR